MRCPFRLLQVGHRIGVALWIMTICLTQLFFLSEKWLNTDRNLIAQSNNSSNDFMGMQQGSSAAGCITQLWRSPSSGLCHQHLTTLTCSEGRGKRNYGISQNCVLAATFGWIKSFNESSRTEQCCLLNFGLVLVELSFLFFSLLFSMLFFLSFTFKTFSCMSPHWKITPTAFV